MAIPGITETHQASRRYSRPSEIIEPQVGSGGGTPTPRKLKDASASISCPALSVAITRVVFITPGKICQKSIGILIIHVKPRYVTKRWIGCQNSTTAV